MVCCPLDSYHMARLEKTDMDVVTDAIFGLLLSFDKHYDSDEIIAGSDRAIDQYVDLLKKIGQ